MRHVMLVYLWCVNGVIVRGIYGSQQEYLNVYVYTYIRDAPRDAPLFVVCGWYNSARKARSQQECVQDENNAILSIYTYIRDAPHDAPLFMVRKWYKSSWNARSQQECAGHEKIARLSIKCARIYVCVCVCSCLCMCVCV